jgi:hypothetical protein
VIRAARKCFAATVWDSLSLSGWSLGGGGSGGPFPPLPPTRTSFICLGAWRLKFHEIHSSTDLWAA